MLDPRDIEQRLSAYLGAPVARLQHPCQRMGDHGLRIHARSAVEILRRHPGRPVRWCCAFTRAPPPTRKARASTPRSIACSPPVIRCRVPTPSRPTITRWARRSSSCSAWRAVRCSPSAASRVRSKLSRWHFFPSCARSRDLHKFDPASPGLREIPHAYAPIGAASADSPLLDRVLAIIANRVETGPLPGLREALNLVTERAPKFRRSPDSLVHMDYHPLNVMVKGVRVTGVIDWVNTDVGDRHLDAAMTAVILSSSALEQAAMDARQPRRQRAARELRGAVHAALSRDGADGLRALPLLPGGRRPAAALDAGHDARARSGGRWASAARRSTK